MRLPTRAYAAGTAKTPCATGAKSFGPHTLNLSMFYGTDFHSDLEPFDAFVLGGPLRLSGFPIDRFAGREHGLNLRSESQPCSSRRQSHNRLRWCASPSASATAARPAAPPIHPQRFIALGYGGVSNMSRGKGGSADGLRPSRE